MSCGEGDGAGKRTGLEKTHEALGATMVNFAGWNMPVQYTTVMDEHTTTREKAGLFDISHMGEFLVAGDGALEFLQKMVVSDISKLPLGKAMYSLMCDEKGFPLDDLFIYHTKEHEYMLVVNACNVTKDFQWLHQHKEDVALTDISDKTAKIDLQGPLTEQIMAKICDQKLPERFHFVSAKVAGIDCRISRTGYTGEDGVELYYGWSKSVELWNAVLEAGKDDGVKPVGLGARDTLRIEACYSLYGHEISENITPVEAGLGWTVKPDKGDFIGKAVLAKQKAEGVPKKLVAFEMIDRGIPREEYKITSLNDEVGFVTSGTFSPTFKKPLGMALVDKEFASVDTEFKVHIRDKQYVAKVVKRPFYEYRGGEVGKS